MHPRQVTQRLHTDRPPEVDSADTTPAVPGDPPSRRPPLPLTPPLRRGSMVPTAWGNLNPFKRAVEALLRRRRDWVERADRSGRDPWPAQLPPADPVADAAAGVIDAPAPVEGWQGLGSVRRLSLLILMLAQTGLATYFMKSVLPYQGGAKLEMLLLMMFAVLFCWI